MKNKKVRLGTGVLQMRGRKSGAQTRKKGKRGYDRKQLKRAFRDTTDGKPYFFPITLFPSYS